MIPFWFQFYAGFSGQSFSEKWTFSLYNVLFTSLPILVVGILDQASGCCTRLLMWPGPSWRGGVLSWPGLARTLVVVILPSSTTIP